MRMTQAWPRFETGLVGRMGHGLMPNPRLWLLVSEGVGGLGHGEKNLGIAVCGTMCVS